MNLRGNRVLLTGASGGIGHALAREFARRGAHLLLNGRDTEKLTAIRAELRSASTDVTVLVSDLSTGSGAALLAHAALSGGPPDLVVHCAGSLSFGPLDEVPADDIMRMWQTNIVAPSLLTRALLPALRRRRRGRIVFVGSILGSFALPMYASYSASKFALRGLAEALRRELHGSGVSVMYVAPRLTRTAFNDGASARLAEALAINQDEPARVATRIVDAIERDRRDLYFGFCERLLVMVNAWFPGLVDRAMRARTRRMRELQRTAA